ncbi:GNAT family N-acetyltransferase [Paenibacillus aurantius]|uniref:GNAT family N-acetyltransferase n=1 Tax=Paenibacillus aurantius TaxID=2918900 RepID=A0AA96LCZ3_9BACL|nr:GNAT family N-acetyltransferase [Paenibacillus aurantius]WNQ10773.1 GNAT family N-acetyltransferase [Paenibacillus aurantius]
MTTEKRIRPLFLVFPHNRLKTPLQVPRLSDEYQLRTYQKGDEVSLAKLLAYEGWKNDEEHINEFLDHVIPEGLFFVVHKDTGEVISTASALHHPSSPHWHFPFGGDMGYVITSPEHRGKGMGYAVSVAATVRLLQAGYKNIRVVTKDHRLSAIKIYLKIGFVPFLYTEDSEDRWSKICRNLNWSFTPKEWIKPDKQRAD